MIHNNILYILLLIVLIFLIIYKNKHFYLEGYRYMWPNMGKINNTNGMNLDGLFFSRKNCENACNFFGCKGYVTTTTGNSWNKNKGKCTIFTSNIPANVTDFNEPNLQGFKYSKGSYLYII